MKISFTDISKTGNRYPITDAGCFAETELHQTAPVQAELVFSRKGDTKAGVQGFLRTGVRLRCDRCLNDYDFPVDTDFQIVLEVPAAESMNVREMECTAAIADIVQVEEPIADFSDILRQQLLLSLPAKNLCSQSCRGLCSQCGIDLNLLSCTCISGEKESPFAVLNALKINK